MLSDPILFAIFILICILALLFIITHNKFIMKMFDWMRQPHHHQHQQQPPEVEVNIGELIIKIEEDGEVRKIRPKLAFVYYYNNLNLNFMSIVTSLTLTSLAPQTFKMIVVDANNANSPIGGVLSGLTYNADATQDIAVVDPADPLSVDIHAVSQQGGTAVTGSGTFVSTALQPDGVTPLVNGIVTGTLVLVNNIVVAIVNPVLTFNQ